MRKIVSCILMREFFKKYEILRAINYHVNPNPNNQFQQLLRVSVNTPLLRRQEGTAGWTSTNKEKWRH